MVVEWDGMVQLMLIVVAGVIAMEEVVVVRDGRPEREVDSKAPQDSQE